MFFYADTSGDVHRIKLPIHLHPYAMVRYRNTLPALGKKYVAIALVNADQLQPQLRSNRNEDDTQAFYLSCQELLLIISNPVILASSRASRKPKIWLVPCVSARPIVAWSSGPAAPTYNLIHQATRKIVDFYKQRT